jgi:23S rRNA G2445 N2-methylase RlmL
MLKYKLTKLLDAPCGAAMNSWMFTAIQQLKSDIPKFQYYGVDVVGSVIEANRQKAATEIQGNYIQFHRVDLSATSTPASFTSTTSRLPADYDLLLSRDALQHLPYQLIARVFRSYCATRSRFLLIGSYLSAAQATSLDNRNQDILVGETFHINVLQAPFSFPRPVEIFTEPIICAEDTHTITTEKISYGNFSVMPR